LDGRLSRGPAWKPGRAVTGKEAEKPITLPIRGTAQASYKSRRRNIFADPARLL
jgi:hypothetical protein